MGKAYMTPNNLKTNSVCTYKLVGKKVYKKGFLSDGSYSMRSINRANKNIEDVGEIISVNEYKPKVESYGYDEWNNNMILGYYSPSMDFAYKREDLFLGEIKIPEIHTNDELVYKGKKYKVAYIHNLDTEENILKIEYEEVIDLTSEESKTNFENIFNYVNDLNEKMIKEENERMDKYREEVFKEKENHSLFKQLINRIKKILGGK